MNLLQRFANLLFLVGLGIVAGVSAERQRPRISVVDKLSVRPLATARASRKPLASKSATSSRTFLGMENDPDFKVVLSIAKRDIGEELGDGACLEILIQPAAPRSCGNGGRGRGFFPWMAMEPDSDEG